jgi:hypothetical protein
LLIPFKTLGLGNALNTIMEWRPQDFSHFSVFELLLLRAAGLRGRISASGNIYAPRRAGGFITA